MSNLSAADAQEFDQRYLQGYHASAVPIPLNRSRSEKRWNHWVNYSTAPCFSTFRRPGFESSDEITGALTHRIAIMDAVEMQIVAIELRGTLQAAGVEHRHRPLVGGDQAIDAQLA